MGLEDRGASHLATLRLTIHASAHARPVHEGIPFLGFTIFPQRRRLKRRKGIHFQRRFATLLKAWQAGALPLERVTTSVRGWVNHVRYGNTVGLRTTVLGRPVRRVTRYRGRRRNASPLEESCMAFTLEPGKPLLPSACRSGVSACRALALPPCTRSSPPWLCGPWRQVQSGDRQMLLALGGVLAGVGANLLANRLQDWKDEADAARDIATNVTAEPALRTELDAVLTRLEAFQHARQAFRPVNTPGLMRPCATSSRARGIGSGLALTSRAPVPSPRDLALSQPESVGWR